MAMCHILAIIFITTKGHENAINTMIYCNSYWASNLEKLNRMLLIHLNNTFNKMRTNYLTKTVSYSGV